MCKVFIGEAEKKLGFILYNYLYSRTNSDFTTKGLISELEKYDSSITQENLQKEIDILVTNGVVSHRVGYYTCLL